MVGELAMSGVFRQFGLAGLVEAVVMFAIGVLLCVRFGRQIMEASKPAYSQLGNLLGMLLWIGIILGWIYGIVALIHFFGKHS